MEQRAREMGKTHGWEVYDYLINQMKKKTKKEK